jgi:hypothetical protein
MDERRHTGEVVGRVVEATSPPSTRKLSNWVKSRRTLGSALLEAFNAKLTSC